MKRERAHSRLELWNSTLPLLLFHAHPLKLYYHIAFSPHFCSSWLLLCSCKDLSIVKEIHAFLVVSNALESDSNASKLMTSYAWFNDLNNAFGIFKRLGVEANTLLWNLIIRFHVYSGLSRIYVNCGCLSCARNWCDIMSQRHWFIAHYECWMRDIWHLICLTK